MDNPHTKIRPKTVYASFYEKLHNADHAESGWLEEQSQPNILQGPTLIMRSSLALARLLHLVLLPIGMALRVMDLAKGRVLPESKREHGLSFLLFWKNFAFLLPHKTRDRVFEPAHQELVEDYLLTRRQRGKWTRRWLTFCFSFRTVLMVGDCFRALLADRGLRFIMTMVPEPLKRWWLS